MKRERLSDVADDVVVICGSRTWNDHSTIRRALRKLPPGTRIRTGGAKGADLIGEHHARRLGMEVEPSFKPNYERYGRFQAPKERNTEMLETKPRPKKVMAFWDGQSGGTLDTIMKACERSIPVDIYTNGASIDRTFEGNVQIKVDV